jgi:hypothetical protein
MCGSLVVHARPVKAYISTHTNSLGRKSESFCYDHNYNGAPPSPSQTHEEAGRCSEEIYRVRPGPPGSSSDTNYLSLKEYVTEIREQ